MKSFYKMFKKIALEVNSEKIRVLGAAVNLIYFSCLFNLIIFKFKINLNPTIFQINYVILMPFIL